MKVNISRVGTWVPEWNGNKEEEEPIEVEYDYQPYEKRRKHIKTRDQRVFIDNVGEKTDEELVRVAVELLYEAEKAGEVNVKQILRSLVEDAVPKAAESLEFYNKAYEAGDITHENLVNLFKVEISDNISGKLLEKILEDIDETTDEN